MNQLTRPLAAAVLGASFLVCPAFAQEGAVKLKTNLKTGKRYVVKQVQQIEMPLGKTDVSMGVQFDVTPHSDGKNKLVKTSVKSMKMAMGGSVMYDSTDPDSGNGIVGPMFSKLMKTEVKAVYDKDDKLVKVETEKGEDGPLGNMGMGPDQIAAILKSFLDHGFPEGPVKPGSKWEHTIEQDMGMGGKSTVKMESVFKGTGTHDGKKYPEIHTTGTIGAQDKAGIVQIKDGTFTQKMFFDTELGLPAYQTSTINATLDAQGQEMKMTTVGTMTLELVEDIK